ncbi:MAG: DNA-formamidopyrimidine glycosylase [Bacillota bacterium]
MPELPEVETIARGLRPSILNKEITGCEVRYKNIIKIPEKEEFKKRVLNTQVLEVKRRGKYLIISLNNEKDLIFHLGMTGKLLIKSGEAEIDKHTHIILNFAEGFDLRFNNIRKFGRVYLINNDEPEKAGGLADLGPEPLSGDFTLEVFKKGFKNRTTFIKSLLLKQGFVAGLGNIYTDEALFEAGISPDRRANTLKNEEKEKLYKAIIKVLKKGIKYCGTSINDYVDSKGVPGSFQDKLKVYGREGETCPECGHKIAKKKIGGRSSHYCPHCQQ